MSHRTEGEAGENSTHQPEIFAGDTDSTLEMFGDDMESVQAMLYDHMDPIEHPKQITKNNAASVLGVVPPEIQNILDDEGSLDLLTGS